MKNIPRNKQTTFIIIVIAIGLLLGGLILVSDPKGAQNEESGKGHAETKEHADTEHHGKKSATKHDDACLLYTSPSPRD